MHIKTCTKRGLTYTFQSPIKPHAYTLCFVPGFRSDFITSKKSQAIYDYATKQGLGFLSWNHAPQGRSVYDYYQDSLLLVQKYKPHYLIGASMGLWISLLIAKQIPIKGILGIGGSIHFTERLLSELTPQQRTNPDYVWKRPTVYDPKGYYEIPVSFLLESRKAIIHNFNGIQCHKLILVHGTFDQEAPITEARELSNKLSKYMDVSLYEIDQGDHRLSSPKELNIVYEKLEELMT